MPPTTNGVVNAVHVVEAGQPALDGGEQVRLHCDGLLENVTQVKPGAHDAVAEQAWPCTPVPAMRQSTMLRLPAVSRVQPQPAGHSGSLVAVGSQLLVHINGLPGIGWLAESTSCVAHWPRGAVQSASLAQYRRQVPEPPKNVHV
ncbi:MAG TPA: hypothetical protein VLM79_27850 [Kofleriaceae bacterium]|nr:hypothetical protein [Kofleriaceae bacterium]